MKSTIQFFFKLIYVPILVIIFIFCLIGFLVTTKVTIDSYSVQRTIGSINTEQLLVQFLLSENHYFYPEGDNQFLKASNISTLAIQLATSIKPTDVRTFLGNELPGMRLYGTEIAIAGEGTDLSNIPYESPPPTEVLLKERKVAEEKLAGRDSEQNEDSIANPEDKTVFIYQSHSWESFLPLLEDATHPNDAISSDERANVIGLGSRLSQNLMKGGIGVEHDKTNMTQELRRKGWSSTKAYTLSGEIVEAAASVKENDFVYYLDLHRDSARKDITTKTIHGESYARIYFVVGKENMHYQENLDFAKKIHQLLEAEYPGISRGVFLKTKSEGNGVYNQDVSTKAMLVEIGGVDNHLEELERTVDAFSEVLVRYIRNEQNVKEVNS